MKPLIPSHSAAFSKEQNKVSNIIHGKPAFG
jgi:hypothetical protein